MTEQELVSEKNQIKLELVERMLFDIEHRLKEAIALVATVTSVTPVTKKGKR